MTILICSVTNGEYTNAAAYTGNSVNALTKVQDALQPASAAGCSSEYPPVLAFRANAGTTYRIAVAGYFAASTAFTLHLLQEFPPNDDFAAASPLSGSSVDLAGQTTVNATGEAGEPNHASAALGEGCTSATSPDPFCLSSVWYSWSSPTDANVSVDLCDPTTKVDTVLGVYAGPAPGTLSGVASNDDAPSGCPGADEADYASQLTFRATGGVTYRIAVAGYQAHHGHFALHLRASPAPPLPPSPQPPPAGNVSPGPSSILSGPVAEVAKTSDLSVTPSAFLAAGSGPSALAARSIGARVTYSLNVAASVRFTVERPVRGRRVKGRCVAQRRSNRRRPSCRRYATLPGSFTLEAKAGVNRFRFTGRLAGRKLRPGSYRLVATPSVLGRVGAATRTHFRIRAV